MFDELFGKEIDDEAIEWRPYIDVIDADEEFIVSAEVPGLEKEDIQLVFNNNVLTISGERKNLALGKCYLYHECYVGTFKRTIKIPGAIAQDKISANYQNGILLVHLPKAHDEKSQDVKINIS